MQTSLFHQRKQGERETVDAFAQVLKSLFHKAYPSGQRGSLETESMGKAVLASQFVAGLVLELRAKVAGHEGDMDTLLAEARFEEAKLRDLTGSRPPPRKPPASSSSNPQEKPASRPSPQTGGQQPLSIQCYGCGAYGPARNKGSPAEAPGKDSCGKGGKPSNVAALTPAGSGVSGGQDGGDSVGEALEKIAATMDSIASGDAQSRSPIPMAEVELEGEPVQDTGSPMTIVSLNFLLLVWARQRPTNQTVPNGRHGPSASWNPPW